MRILTVLGPTASGKTRLAVELAGKINGAIISADSRQVFRGMDIGTGKDLQEYGSVPYYLIDIREAGEEYHVAAFREDFIVALSQITARGRVPVLCGGTGLYIQAALRGLPFAAVPVNPELRLDLENKSNAELLALFHSIPSAYSARADTSTRKRLLRAIEIGRYLQQNVLEIKESPLFDPLVIGISLSPETRRERITERLHRRLASGFLEEVQRLLDEGVNREKLFFYGLEYKFAAMHLAGELDYPTMVSRLNTAIHQFAKRQMTFFRKLEKDGLKIHWINGALPLETQVKTALALMDTGR
ncbi:MAG TPA: tRNA (adenosine(37)-N6)-dimethylallyltransferase MiaA [Anseongella sp.]|nr:tRNA (adenosine(37)-N6)-dimethylallyltransferase MiaA [Anseongella sp.]